MNLPKDGGPAFPQDRLIQFDQVNRENEEVQGQRGMTLRDWLALAGLWVTLGALAGVALMLILWNCAPL